MKKAGKKRVIELLNMFMVYLDLPSTDQIDYDSKEFNQGMLCMIIEVLVRHARDVGKGVYYLTPEEYAILKV